MYSWRQNHRWTLLLLLVNVRYQSNLLLFLVDKLSVGSMRDSVGHLRLLPPYTGLGFDHAIFSKAKGLREEGATCKTALIEMEKDHWLSQYGRPLYVLHVAMFC